MNNIFSNANSMYGQGLLGYQPQTGYGGGLLGMGSRKSSDEKSQYEQMASPYAQWAAQQLAAVTPQAQQQPVQQPQVDPAQEQAARLWNYYFNSNYNNS